MKDIILLVSLSVFFNSVFSQTVVPLPVDSAFNVEYEKRIKLSRIEGKYIPRDLNDALNELDKIMDIKAIEKFKLYSEEEARTQTHYNFGKYMMSRWSLIDGSRLSAWFRLNKISNPDDMVDCLITTYHRKINNKPIGFEELATYYFHKRKKLAIEMQKTQMKRDSIRKANESLKKAD